MDLTRQPKHVHSSSFPHLLLPSSQCFSSILLYPQREHLVRTLGLQVATFCIPSEKTLLASGNFSGFFQLARIIQQTSPPQPPTAAALCVAGSAVMGPGRLLSAYFTTQGARHKNCVLVVPSIPSSHLCAASPAPIAVWSTCSCFSALL